MKTVFNVVLGLCALALVYVCYRSIMGPIEFDEEKKVREKAVIARLIDIRKAQQEYRNQHNQQYTSSFDTLIAVTLILGSDQHSSSAMRRRRLVAFHKMPECSA